MMLWHLGITGEENSYQCFNEKPDELIERLLNTWNNLGFAIERPLFPDAEAQEWIAYDGDRIVRQMTLVREEHD